MPELTHGVAVTSTILVLAAREAISHLDLLTLLLLAGNQYYADELTKGCPDADSKNCWNR